MNFIPRNSWRFIDLFSAKISILNTNQYTYISEGITFFTEASHFLMCSFLFLMMPFHQLLILHRASVRHWYSRLLPLSSVR